MSLSENTQAILLLTSHFSKQNGDSAKPLTPKEWGRFAFWLKDNSKTPDQLLSGNLDSQLAGWTDKTITIQRVSALLNRGSALALALEKWLRSGLWVLSRSDQDYPRAYKRLLAASSPAILFGCGNRALLNKGGLAVVGSRNTSSEDLAFSRSLGEIAATNGFSIISGGARGVDENAMIGALEAEGMVAGVLADNLLRAATSQKYRKYLIANNLVLISPFYPEAGFNVGNAMQRNKYIYCLANAAVVVHSGTKGGTWSGANENLKNNWVPLYVKKSEDISAGNQSIVDQGAVWLPTESLEGDFSAILDLSKKQKKYQQDSVQTSTDHSKDISEPPLSSVASNEPYSFTGPEKDGSSETSSVAENSVSKSAHVNSRAEVPGFYEIFLHKVKPLLIDAAMTSEELAEALVINKSQVNAWLKQAVADNKVLKLTRPVRYEWNESQQTALQI